MRITKTLFLLAFLGIAFSCSKSSSSTPTPKTNTELLAGTSSKSWKSTSAIAVNGTAQLDLFTLPTFSKPCILDNLLVIKTNNTYELHEGATKCSATDPDLMLTSNWSLSADGKTFHVDKFIFAGVEKDNLDFTIVELTDTSLKTTTNLTISGTAYVVTLTFVSAT